MRGALAHAAVDFAVFNALLHVSLHCASTSRDAARRRGVSCVMQRGAARGVTAARRRTVCSVCGAVAGIVAVMEEEYSAKNASP